MESKPAFRSAPLLDRALRIASQRAQTYDSLAESLGVTPEDAALYWFSINILRRGLGHDLPPLSASARCWYDPTWHLEALLETFQINEGLASHYGRIFYDPEGGHLELNMAANEVVYAIGLEHPDIDVARLRRVCVHACEPECGIELLAANAGKVLLSIEEYRDEADVYKRQFFISITMKAAACVRSESCFACPRLPWARGWRAVVRG